MGWAKRLMFEEWDNRTRPIDKMRNSLGGEWTWDGSCRRWSRQEDGLSIDKRAAMAPQFDGDDDSFETRWFAYTSKGACFASSHSINGLIWGLQGSPTAKRTGTPLVQIYFSL